MLLDFFKSKYNKEVLNDFTSISSSKKERRYYKDNYDNFSEYRNVCNEFNRVLCENDFNMFVNIKNYCNKHIGTVSNSDMLTLLNIYNSIPKEDIDDYFSVCGIAKSLIGKINFNEMFYIYGYYYKLVFMCKEVGLLPINPAEIYQNIASFKVIYDNLGTDNFGQYITNLKAYSTCKEDNDELLYKASSIINVSYYIELLSSLDKFNTWSDGIIAVKKDYDDRELNIKFTIDRDNMYRLRYYRELPPMTKYESSLERTMEESHNIYCRQIHTALCEIFYSKHKPNVLPHIKYVYSKIDTKDNFGILGWILFDSDNSDKETYKQELKFKKS